MKAVSVLATLMILGLAFASPAVGEEPSAYEVREDLKKLQDFIRNTNRRLKGNHRQFMSGPTDDRPPPGSPIEACCGQNVDVMLGLVDKMDAEFQELDLAYRKAGDERAVEINTIVRQDLEQVEVGIIMFSRQPTVDLGAQALMGLIRPFNQYRESLYLLMDCCWPAVEEADSELGVPDKDEKKKEKKKKTKKKAGP